MSTPTRPSTSTSNSKISHPPTPPPTTTKQKEKKRPSYWKKFKMRQTLQRRAKKDEDGLIDALDYAFDPTLESQYLEQDLQVTTEKEKGEGGSQNDGPVDDQGKTMFVKKRREMKVGLKELEESGEWVVL